MPRCGPGPFPRACHSVHRRAVCSGGPGGAANGVEGSAEGFKSGTETVPPGRVPPAGICGFIGQEMHRNGHLGAPDPAGDGELACTGSDHPPNREDDPQKEGHGEDEPSEGWGATVTDVLSLLTSGEEAPLLV